MSLSLPSNCCCTLAWVLSLTNLSLFCLSSTGPSLYTQKRFGNVCTAWKNLGPRLGLGTVQPELPQGELGARVTFALVTPSTPSDP